MFHSSGSSRDADREASSIVVNAAMVARTASGSLDVICARIRNRAARGPAAQNSETARAESASARRPARVRRLWRAGRRGGWRRRCAGSSGRRNRAGSGRGSRRLADVGLVADSQRQPASVALAVMASPVEKSAHSRRIIARTTMSWSTTGKEHLGLKAIDNSGVAPVRRIRSTDWSSVSKW